MKANDVAGALGAELHQSPQRIFIKRALLRHWIAARHKERWIHRPPSHDQVYEHADRVLIVEASAHRKKELFLPISSSEQRRRYDIHVEERSMIGYQQQGPRVIDSFNILQAVNAHQVVSRDVNPARAEETLAPGPETLPLPEIHPMSKTEREPLEGRKYRDFFRGRNQNRSNVQRPGSNVNPTWDLGLWTLDFFSQSRSTALPDDAR